MITAVDLHRDLAGLPMLKERYGHPTDAESLKSFATLAAYRDGGIFATHFRGSSGWERHPQGDEVVQILEGATRFDVIVDEGLQLVRIRVGITRLDVLNGAMKNMGADGLLDEFREVPFFHAPGAQKGAQGEIGFLRDLDVPADCFVLHI